MTLGSLHTTKRWQETLADIAECFTKWGVDDYVLPRKVDSERQGYVEVAFSKRGGWAKPRCGRFATPEQNLRAIWQALDAVRKADQRGIGELMAEASKLLSIPSPDDPRVVLARHSGLAVNDDTPSGGMVHAYREALKRTHPDHGGNRQDFDAVRRAGSQLGVA